MPGSGTTAMPRSKICRSAADLGVTNTTSDVIATRGERLVLIRTRLSRRDERTRGVPRRCSYGSSRSTPTTGSRRWVTFDLDDFECRHRRARRALPRRRSGSPRAHVVGHHGGPTQRSIGGNSPRRRRTAVTSTIAGAHRSRPASWPNTSAPAWDLDQDVRTYVEIVHRLSDLGAVVHSRGA